MIPNQLKSATALQTTSLKILKLLNIRRVDTQAYSEKCEHLNETKVTNALKVTIINVELLAVIFLTATTDIATGTADSPIDHLLEISLP